MNGDKPDIESAGVTADDHSAEPPWSHPSVTRLLILLALGLLGAFSVWPMLCGFGGNPRESTKEVLFWHFWGGDEARIVDKIVDGFNASQAVYRVRAVAMPGNNLDLKLFLAVAGGSPPDLVNQDDPILGDWGSRDAIVPLGEIMTADEYSSLEAWLYPAARTLGSYNGKLYGLCNGLDVRAIFVNQTWLDQKNLAAPTTIEELDALCEKLWSQDSHISLRGIPFLPNPRNLWAWGIVFGGKFSDESTNLPTLTDPGIERALTWMAGYGQKYGAIAAALRARDQSLSGKVFPLLAGHYALVEDGQWRCRDVARYVADQKARGVSPLRIEVIRYPYPEAGRKNPELGRPAAGWINGNFFIVPRKCRCPDGAWAFMKYWSGFGGYEHIAAAHLAEGGWIPPSPQVALQPEYQTFLNRQPLFRKFVELASSPNQTPRPNLRGTVTLDREVRAVAEEACMRGGPESVPEILKRGQSRLMRVWKQGPEKQP